MGFFTRLGNSRLGNWIDRLVQSDKPQTNADHIRSMSDEELTENVSCPYIATECIHLDDEIECEQCKLQWLKTEAKE